MVSLSTLDEVSVASFTTSTVSIGHTLVKLTSGLFFHGGENS